MALNGALYIIYCNETISSNPVGILHWISWCRNVPELQEREWILCYVIFLSIKFISSVLVNYGYIFVNFFHNAYNGKINFQLK